MASKSVEAFIPVDEQKRQLIERITKEVIEALKDGGARPAPPRADVRPPIGICTGDYSQFPELAGRLHGTAGAAPPVSEGAAAPVSPAAAPAEPIPLTGIITANQLQQAWGASADGTALLADDARLTPLANDLARQHPERIRRASAAARGTDGRSSSADTTPWLGWIDGPCSAAEGLAAHRAPHMSPASTARTPAALASVVRDLTGALLSRRVAGGVLFVQNAARAACYANRCASIRAVVGTCGEAVEQGIAELGANVLLIEYPHVGPRAMEAMVDRIMQRPPVAPPVAQRDLADLRRCE